MKPATEKAMVAIFPVLIMVFLGTIVEMGPTRIATAVAIYLIIVAVIELIAYRYKDDPRFAHLRSPS